MIQIKDNYSNDVLFTYNPFKICGSFKWTNNLTWTEKIRFFSVSLTTHVIIFLRKTFEKEKGYFIQII